MLNVSIVTYHTDINELDRCVQSLKSPYINTIYVIDNSRQLYIENYCKNDPRIFYFPKSNVGYGSANNIALKLSLDNEVKYHLVLNTDVYFEPSIIDSIVDYLENHEEVGQLIPNVIYPNGEVQFVCRLLPSPLDLFTKRFMPQLFAKRDNRHCLKFFDHKSAISVPFLQGSFMFFRTSVLREVGLFDERYFMYAEDIDITRRIYRYYKTLYWPEVTIVHAHRAASYKDPKMLRLHICSVVKYFFKWGWIFDRERHKWNKNILSSLKYK